MNTDAIASPSSRMNLPRHQFLIQTVSTRGRLHASTPNDTRNNPRLKDPSKCALVRGGDYNRFACGLVFTVHEGGSWVAA